jgi:cell division protein FtsQ
MPKHSSRSRRGARHRTWRATATFMLCLGLVILAGWTAMVVYQSVRPRIVGWFVLKNVLVTGNSQVTRAEVLEHLKLPPVENLWSVNPKRLAARLQAHPWIKRATVSRVPPHTLVVEVMERHGAAVMRSSTMTVLLDEEGHPLSILGELHEPQLPVLVGLNPKLLLNGDAGSIRAAQKGVELANVLTRTFEGRPEIDVTNRDNFVASLHGVRLQFGSSAFDEKWNRYQKIESHLAESLTNGRADGRSDIDLRYPGKVIVRERG